MSMEIVRNNKEEADLSDDELLDKILAKGRDGRKAAAKLYKRYEKQLMDFYLSNTANREDAEDLWQDMWCIIFQKPKYFRDSMTVPTLKTLIMRIANNQVINYKKGRAARSGTQSFSDVSGTPGNEGYTPEEKVGMKARDGLVLSDYDKRYTRKDIVKAVSRAIRGYSKKAKSVLWRKLVGFTNQEISERTGLSVKTVKNVYSELLALAKKELEAFENRRKDKKGKGGRKDKKNDKKEDEDEEGQSL